MMESKAGGGCALVTGAARRIGRAIALELAAAGWPAAVHFNGSADDAREVVDTIERSGGKAVAISCDLEDRAAVSRLIPECAARLGPVRVLVNNASVFDRDEIGSLTPETWQRHQAVNVTAPVLLSQSMARHLPPDVDGNIVNIVDQRVLRPVPLYFSYSVSKSALWSATQMLAQALAPRIRVNAIGPGPVLRNVNQSAEQFLKETLATPLQRAVEAEDVARAVTFLLSQPAITGQIIAVDSGQHIAWQTPDIVEGEM